MKYDLVLLDASAIIYRAFYGVPRHFSTAKGEPTNAVFGFTNSLFRIIDQFCLNNIAVAYDSRKKTFRHETYVEYKATREKAPDELHIQIPRTIELLDAFNISHFVLDGYEADDIIGTLATKFLQKYPEKTVLIVSGDHDLLQLVNENIQVALFKNGFKEFKVYDSKSVNEKFQVYPNQIIDLKALQGDSSDNIPGVPSVGPKTASKWLQEYKTLDNLYENLDALKPNAKAKLVEYKNQAYLSQSLATIECDVPININWEDVKWHGVERNKIQQFFDELQFRNMSKKLAHIRSKDDIDLDYAIQQANAIDSENNGDIQEGENTTSSTDEIQQSLF